MSTVRKISKTKDCFGMIHELMQVVSNLGNNRLMILGDFNCVRDDSERENCTYKRNDTEGFNKYIANANLMDLAINNSQFTWFGPAGKKSKLDRMLVNHEWWGGGG